MYPTKETATAAARAAIAPSAATAAVMAAYWSKELGCLVTWIEPGSNFMVLEVEGMFIKIVGDRIGWIIAGVTVDWVVNCFEEITNAQA